MRVAFVAAGTLDPIGREHIVAALQPLVERQARRHDVIIHTLGHGGTLRRYSALVDRLKRSAPIDVVHAYGALPGSVAVLAARRLRVPSVVTLDGGEFVAMPDIGYGLQTGWRSRLAVSTVMRLATRLTVCSRYQEHLAKTSGVDPEVISLGVESQLFQPAARAATLDGVGRRHLWRLLNVGRLSAVKDQATLLEAFRLLLGREPQVELDMVGEDALGGATQALAHRLGVGPQVRFHGAQPKESLLELYRRADLFIQSSRHEASGMAALEAAACGVPTVGTAVGYVVELAPYAAVSVPPCDPAALADAIAGMLADDQRRSRIASAAREWAVAHDASWTAAQFDRVYRELSAAGT